MYPKFLIFKLSNVSNKDALSIRKRLLCGSINKRSEELQHVNLKPKQLSTISFYILNKFITFHDKKLLQKSLNRKLSSLTRYCSLPTFTSSKTITNFTQNELFQEEFDLLKADLYLSKPPDKIQKSKIFTTFEKFIILLLTTLSPRKLKII